MFQDTLTVTPALRYTNIKDDLKSGTSAWGGVGGVSSRHDAYFNPQIGVKYNPVDWLILKTNLSKVDPVGGPRAFENDLHPTISDITAASYENSFYILERTGRNNVTKYNVDNPAQAIWQWSTEGSETNSNPHDLVFESEQKAYLLRYGCNNARIVNPSATVEADFKIGELDLSAYGFEGNVPNMHSGVIADGKLFITLQRFDATFTTRHLTQPMLRCLTFQPILRSTRAGVREICSASPCRSKTRGPSNT